MTTGVCKHTKSVTSNLSQQGIMVEVTFCAACGEALDHRALSEKDMVGSELVSTEEARIQASARLAKAEEALEESGEAGTLQVTPTHSAEEELMASLNKKSKLLAATEGHAGSDTGKTGVDLSTPVGRDRPYTGVVLCKKRGGEIPACDTGSGAAHHCTNGKWGILRTFNSPCPCIKCHERS